MGRALLLSVFLFIRSFIVSIALSQHFDRVLNRKIGGEFPKCGVAWFASLSPF